MTWWNTLVSFVSKLPVAQYIKPLWKGGLKALVGFELEQLRPQLKAIASNGPAAVDAAFAALDHRLDDGIAALPLPDAVKAAILMADGALDSQLDHVRLLIDAALQDQAPGAIDAAFDSGKAAILARIDAL